MKTGTVDASGQTVKLVEDWGPTRRPEGQAGGLGWRKSGLQPREFPKKVRGMACVYSFVLYICQVKQRKQPLTPTTMRTADIFHLSTRCVYTCLAVSEAATLWGEMTAKHGLAHKSESGSEYVIVDDMVYRMSDHWGQVGSSDWALEDPNQVSGEFTTSGKPMLLISHRITDKRVHAIGAAPLSSFKTVKRYL